MRGHGCENISFRLIKAGRILDMVAKQAEVLHNVKGT